MYRIECFINGEWKPMIDSGLVVYYREHVFAEMTKQQLQIMCSENGMVKEFRVVSHTF